MGVGIGDELELELRGVVADTPESSDVARGADGEGRAEEPVEGSATWVSGDLLLVLPPVTAEVAE